MKNSRIILTVVWMGILGILLAGCDYFNMDETAGEGGEVSKKVARVNDKFLYAKDLAGIVPAEAAPEDSVRIAKRFITNWIRKQLMIDEASSKIEFDQQELERKILDYRYALMVYEYEKYYVNATLEKNVTEEEIKQYYEQNKQNFELKQIIMRGVFVKVPKEAPRLNKLRDFMELNEKDDLEKLKSYSYRFSTDFMLDQQLWVNFEELVANTPLMSIPNKVQWLETNKYVETSDGHYLYFLKVIDYKLSDEISPLEFVRDQIETIIINKRKTELASQLEKEIYEKAEKNDAFEIYAN